MFKNLKISVKLLISAIVFIIPISVLLYFILFAFEKDIKKAQDEIDGNKALGSLVGMTNDIIEFQNLLLLRKADQMVFKKSYGEEFLINLKNDIDSNCSHLIENTKIYKISNNYAQSNSEIIEPFELKKIWESEILTQIQQNEIDNMPFEKFCNGSQSLIKLISDESGLILDPDLDSYYLMDISTLVLPKLQIQIGEVLAVIQNSYSNGIISDYDVNKVRLILDIIENDYLNRIEQGVNTSVMEDKHFYDESPSLKQNLPLFFGKFSNDLKDFITSVRKWYLGEGNNGLQMLSEIKHKGYISLNSSTNFWVGVNTEFDILLDKRIQHFRNIRTIALLSSGFAFAIAVLLVLYVARQISRHLSIVTSIAVEIANGNIDKAVSDLSADKNLGVFKHYIDDKVAVKDEILILFRAIRKMTFNLSSLLIQVSKSGNQVSNTTFKITSSAHDIEATVAEQAALTNQVNATSKDISKTATELARTMDYLNQSFNENATMLLAGLENLNEIKFSINELFESSGEISKKLELIEERAASINSVITTITKVANQTNLVSLNASIEAERAGSFGTGFAVVAREIRRLADQTAVAALNIEDMITEMQVAVSEGGVTILKYMDKSKNSAEKTAQIIDRISVLIDRTNELPEKINIANVGMKQQSESAVQIDESMQQLNSAAIQTRNTIIEFNSATEKLNEAVIGLTDELRNFSLKSIS